MTRLRILSFVRDEEDIIESWVRYHAPFSHMHVTMHRCTDRTESILRALQAEGFPLTLETDDSDFHAQSPAMNRMLQVALQTDADFILPLDADEFLTVDAPSVQGALERLPQDHVTLLPWRTYVPRPEDEPCDDPLKRITYYRQREMPHFHKILIPAAMVRGKTFHIPLGSHALLHHQDGEMFPSVWASEIVLAHFPVRSAAQLRAKVLRCHASNLANPMLKPGEGYHLERLLARCQNPCLIEAAELCTIALSYSYDSPTTENPLTHHPLIACWNA